MLNLLIVFYLVNFTESYLFKNLLFKNINKLTIFEETKTMINQKNSYGFLSTISNQKKIDGYPQTSIVGYSCDEFGNPILCLSDIAMHSNNLKTNIRVSLGINEKFFRNANDMRSTFIGDLKKINDKDESALLKDKFINSHDDGKVCKEEGHKEVNYSLATIIPLLLIIMNIHYYIVIYCVE